MLKLVVISVLLISQSFGDMVADIKRCKTFENNADRLQCYDFVTKDISSIDSKRSPNNNSNGNDKGKWVETISESPIDDSKTVVLMLKAEEPIMGQFSFQNHYPLLIVRCSQNKTDAYITFDRYLGLDRITVLTRIDKNKAKRRSWSISTDNKAAFAPNAITFSKSLMGHKKLFVQTTPYSSNPVSTYFDITGAKNAIRTLRKTCNW